MKRMNNQSIIQKRKYYSLLWIFMAVILFSACENQEVTLETVRISFVTNGGNVMDALEVNYNTIAAKPANPVKENAVFWNWYTDAEFKHVFDFTQPLKVDVILYAKWMSTCVVTFETNGGSLISPDTIGAGNYITLPGLSPRKPGFKFVNWCTDAALTTLFDTNTPVTDNITLYAKYSDMFTLTFDCRGGNAVVPMQVKGNTTILNPTLTHPKGYSFWEWRTEEGKPFNPQSQPIMEDMTLYAIWNMPVSMFIVDGGKFWGLKPEYKVTTEYVDIPANLPGLTTPGINDYNFYENQVVKSISIPATFTYIGAQAFAFCPNLKSLFMYGVKEIGSQIIKSSGLETVNIPGTVTKISDSFALCSAYKTVRFFKPDTSQETALDINWTFWESLGLEKIVFDRSTPPVFGQNVLNSKKLKEIVVPAASFAAYKAAWPNYALLMKKQ